MRKQTKITHTYMMLQNPEIAINPEYLRVNACKLLAEQSTTEDTRRNKSFGTTSPVRVQRSGQRRRGAPESDPPRTFYRVNGKPANCAQHPSTLQSSNRRCKRLMLNLHESVSADAKAKSPEQRATGDASAERTGLAPSDL